MSKFMSGKEIKELQQKGDFPFNKKVYEGLEIRRLIEKEIYRLTGKAILNYIFSIKK